MENYLPTDYQKYIALSRYARWQENLGRRETWKETVDRYFDYTDNWFKDHATSDSAYLSLLEISKGARESVLNLGNMPSMRALMTAGAALDRCNVCAFNCAFLAMDDIRAFDETMYILMCGTGVGFSVEAKYVNKLPEVADVFYDTDTVIKVGDSKIGWSTAFRELIHLLYAGKVPQFDVSKVRPKGARLKTFGGRASGPEPLLDLFNFCVRSFKSAAGRRLKDIEVHDIVCKIAEIVVVGGVRRSALISISDLSSYDMRMAKSGEWWKYHGHRALANNSAIYYNKPEIGEFLDEWLSLYRSNSGERGIFSKYAINKLDNGRRDFGPVVGGNPCCVTGECKILTRGGYVPIESVVGLEVDVWNGFEWSTVKPYSTGIRKVINVSLSDGTNLVCTHNHRFPIVDMGMVEASELVIGDKLEKYEMPVVEGGIEMGCNGYSQGFYSGDGNAGYDFSWLYSPKFSCIDRLCGKVVGNQDHRKRWNHGPMLPKSFVPIEADLKYRLNWLAGILDSDGTVTRDKNGNGLQIVSVDHDFLRNVRLMLTTMGVRAKVVKASDAGYRKMPDGNGGADQYFCQETKRLLIGNWDTYKLVGMGLRLNRLNVHGNPPQRDARQFVRVVSIDEVEGDYETFCFTDELRGLGTFNGIVTGQCEILLRSCEFCNLTTSIIRSTDTKDDIRRKVRIATFLGTVQSAWTNFKYLRKAWKRNCDEERLLGVSMTGIMDHPLMGAIESEERDEFLRELRASTIAWNKEFAEMIGIEPSAAIGCIKPEGTVSALANSAPGMHTRYFRYGIRTVRADAKDPLTQLMKDQGIPWEPDITKPDSVVVFSFPMESPEESKTRADLTAIDQLKIWLAYKKNWAEHTVSVTIYVRSHEWIEVADWVYKNFDDITGISFLPYSDFVYKQAPFQETSKEEYDEWVKKMQTMVDWSKLVEYEKFDTTTSSQEMACTGNACEIQ